MANPTDPLASGASTSEGKLTIAGAITGILVALVGGIAPLFTSAADKNPNVLWLQLASLVCGGALSILNTTALAKSRTLVKGGILDLLQEGTQAITPLVAQAVLSKYLKPTPTEAPAVPVVSYVQPVGKVSSTSPTPVETPQVRP